MNISLLAQNAYGSRAAAPTRTNSAIEYDVLARVTSALQKADTAPKKAEALHRNRELWGIFAGDVATGDNVLPDALRAQIFYLAQFTDQHSSKVLRDDADIGILVEINTSIMRGLRGQTGPVA